MIKIGCSSFPVGREKYMRRFNLVELDQLLDKNPRSQTTEKWRAQSPDRFEFITCASRQSTHLPKPSRTHSFSSLNGKTPSSLLSARSRLSIGKSFQIAEALKSKILFFKMPNNISPSSDQVARFQNIFRDTPRGTLTFIWDPPITWPHSLVERISQSLQIYPAINPLHKNPFTRFPIQYFRLGNQKHTQGIHAFSDSDLMTIKKKCLSKLTYVIFNNGPYSFADAIRFSSLIA